MHCVYIGCCSFFLDASFVRGNVPPTGLRAELQYPAGNIKAFSSKFPNGDKVLKFILLCGLYISYIVG